MGEIKKTKEQLLTEINRLKSKIKDLDNSVSESPSHAEGDRGIDNTIKVSEKKYRLMIKNMMNGYAYHEIVLDDQNNPVDYIFLDVNHGFEKLTGLKKNDVLGKKTTEVFPQIANDPANWIGRYGEVANNGKDLKFESFSEPLEKWFSVYAYCPESGYFVTIFEDISKQKLAEKELLKLKYLQDETEKAAKIGGWTFDVKTLKQTWTDEIFRILEIDVSKGAPKVPEGMDYIDPPYRQMAEKAIKECIETGTPYNQEWQITTLKGNKRWVRSIANPHQKKGLTTSITGSFQDITTQKEFELSLIESKRFNESLLNTSHDIIYVYDIVDRKNVYSNEGISKVLDYSVQEIKDMGSELISSLMHKDDFVNYINKTVPRYQNAQDGEIIEHEYRMKHKNGNWLWIRSKESIFKRCSDGTPWQIFGIMSNITEHKQAEEELKASEAKFKSLMHQSPFVVELYDLDGLQIEVNTAYEELWQFPASTTVNIFNILKSKEVIETGLIEYVNRAYNGESVKVPEYCFNPTGETESRGFGRNRWLNTSIYPIKDSENNVTNIVVVHQDITERKQAETLLRDEKERIRTILDLLGDPIFVKDNDHRMTLANKAFYDLFGMDEKSVIGYTLAEAVPENERKQFLSIDRKVLDTGIPDIREEELTIGEHTSTIITRKIRFTGASGEYFLVGSIHDISHRKKSEIQLLKEKKYSEEIINALPGLFYQISPEGKFTNWNKNFETVSGYSNKEMGEISPMDLFEGDDKKRIAESIAHVFSHGSVTVEADLTSKEGKKVPYLFSGKRILLNDVHVLVGMGIDVSDLKLAESELKKHQENLEELIKERTIELETKNKELDNAMKVFVGRELAIRKLQDRIRALEGK